MSVIQRIRIYSNVPQRMYERKQHMGKRWITCDLLCIKMHSNYSSNTIVRSESLLQMSCLDDFSNARHLFENDGSFSSSVTKLIHVLTH